MKTVKVVHLTSVHRDGDVRIFHKECASLAAAGFDVSLVVPNTQSRTEKGVKIVSFNYKPKSRFDRMRKTVKLVEQKAFELDGDIYHIHDPELLRTGLRLIRKGKKVIYDTHEDTPRQMLSKPYLNPALRKLISFTFERFENYASRRMTAVVTATPHINQRFLKLNSKSVNVNNFPVKEEISTAVTDFSNRKAEVCYIGGIGLERGLKQMIEAAGISQTPLHLAGAWPNGLKNEMQQLPGWNNVHDLNHISREEALKIKRECMAGLVIFSPVPNHIYAQPNKMFEYMASGLPVIGSDFPLWRSILIENNCGICVDPNDSSALANAIKDLMQNPEKAKMMGENGLRAVQERYNWDHEKQQLIALYEGISAE